MRATVEIAALILKPSSLGDIVHTLPAVARLKAARPDSSLAWLVNTEWAPLLQGNPDLSVVVPFPRREFRGLQGWKNLGPWLRQHIIGLRPELALDFQGLLRTALLGRLSGAKRFHGLADAREGARWFYDRAVPLRRREDGGPLHAVERYGALVDDLLGEPLPRGAVRFPLPVGEPLEPDVPPADFVVLHPFARGAGKSLGPTQVRAICAQLAPVPVLVVGKRSPSFPLGGMGPTNNGIDLLDRTSLLQLVWLLRRAAFTISVDSGPMHLAAALTDRLVGLHAWSDPRRVGPYNPGAHVWKAGRLWQVRELAQAPNAVMENAATLERDLTPDGIRKICALAVGSA